ncbi:MAG: hypothetical protein KAX24_14225, partial [Anaerolineae bacterium]|nr:hypothetical protein [Anaerolineae bacterium]
MARAKRIALALTVVASGTILGVLLLTGDPASIFVLPTLAPTIPFATPSPVTPTLAPTPNPPTLTPVPTPDPTTTLRAEPQGEAA